MLTLSPPRQQRRPPLLTLLLLLLLSMLFGAGLQAQGNDLEVLRKSDGASVTIPYADVYRVIEDRATGLATVVYGPRGQSRLETSETLDAIAARGECDLLLFTPSLVPASGRQALSFGVIDSVSSRGGVGQRGGVIYASSIYLDLAPMELFPVEDGESIYVDYYSCGGTSPDDPLITATSVGYGANPVYDRNGRNLRFRTYLGEGGIDVRQEGAVLIFDGGGIAGGGGGGGATPLTILQTPSSATFDHGSGIVDDLLGSSATRAGLMLPAQHTKLQGIEAGAEVNHTGPELVSLLDTETGSTTWRTGGGGGGGGREERFVTLNQPDATIEIAGERPIGSTLSPTLTGSAAGGFDLTIPSQYDADEITFFGYATTANGSGDLVLRIDNSANLRDRWVTVEFYSKSSNQRIDMPGRGMIVRQTTLGYLTTVTVTNVGGNFPNGYIAILR